MIGTFICHTNVIKIYSRESRHILVNLKYQTLICG
jgi:hypothetical protein